MSDTMDTVIRDTQEIVEIVEEVCGLYFRSILLESAGLTVPQHRHDHDHATLVASGGVRVWVDDEFRGTYVAPHVIEIRAGTEHRFESIMPHTRLVCVHSIESAESIKMKGL